MFVVGAVQEALRTPAWPEAAIRRTPPSVSPIARMNVSQTSRDAIDVDARGSTDSDGQVTDYLWDFGDGTYATGSHVHHVFSAPGTYRVNLVVRDDHKALGFATADHDFTITPYAFNGFFAPINNQPVLNGVRAGQAIPVKFSLGGAQGSDILDPGYPKVRVITCDTGAPLDEIETTVTANASGLTYDPKSDTYTYVWKTDPAWAGTCHRLEVGLNDATRHVADFKFR